MVQAATFLVIKTRTKIGVKVTETADNREDATSTSSKTAMATTHRTRARTGRIATRIEAVSRIGIAEAVVVSKVHKDTRALTIMGRAVEALKLGLASDQLAE